jgi:hypothetical protein
MQRMANSDLEMARRLLKAALNKLDGESRGDKESSNSILFSEKDAGAPVVLVVVGGLNAQDEDAPPVLVAAPDGRREIEKSFASGLDQTQGAQTEHPGLERFSLAVTDSHPAAPKACFMEPGRTCVSSGACEMRGF